MGQCMVRATIPVAICVACILVLAALSRPQPLADRLAVIPESETRIDNVKPFDAREKWAANGSQAGLHRLNPTRVAYFDKRIRSLMRPPFRVLDAGCGGGLVSNALAGLPGYSVEGVDMSPEALRFAQETAAHVNLTSVAFREASLYSIPFANESFDVVIMSDVLEHLLDLPRGLAEVARVLRPGGVFLFDTIDRTWSSYLVAIVGAERVVGILSKNTHDWRLFIRPKELKKGLEQSGFHSFAYESFDPTPRSLLELSLFQLGLLPLEWMRGGWHIGSASMVMVSYIGQAVKSGKPKAAADSAPAKAAPQASARSAPARAAPQAKDSRSPRGEPRKADSPTASKSSTQPPEATSTGAPKRELRQVDVPDATSSSSAQSPKVKRTTNLTYQYKVGEDVELRIAAGPSKGSWVRGRVRSLGNKSDTYWLHVPAMPPADRDIPWTIPASSLRRLEAAAVQFKVGERTAIMAESGPRNGTWLLARVVSLGSLADTYNVVVESGNASGLEVQSVPARKLQKAPQPQGQAEVERRPPAQVQAPQPQGQAEADRRPPARAQAKPPEPALAFEVGEDAEIRGGGGHWTKCKVAAAGEKPDTYDVTVSVKRPPGFHTIRNVPVKFLRKYTARGQAKADFKAGQRCLLQTTAGPRKGSWTSCTIIGKGARPDTYDIRVPTAEKDDRVISGVPVGQLVDREAAGQFKVGEMATVKIFKGKAMGQWVPCVITSRGPHPNRYDIHVVSTGPQGHSEVRNVSAFALRREEDPSGAIPAWATKALAAVEGRSAKALAAVGGRSAKAAAPVAHEQYKVGEVALVKVTGGPKDGKWVKCTIWGLGNKTDTYNIRVGTAQPPGHIDLTDIPASGFRKVPVTVFQAGGQAEIQVIHGPLSGVWMRCLILGSGNVPDTYNVRMLGVPFQEGVVFSDIPAQLLRELPKDAPVWPPPSPPPPPPEQKAGPAAPPEAASVIFEDGETAEVRASEGWVRCIIGERGRGRNSYNIRVVSDNTEGYLDVPDVPAHKLRKSAKPSTISMIMWILEILFSMR